MNGRELENRVAIVPFANQLLFLTRFVGANKFDADDLTRCIEVSDHHFTSHRRADVSAPHHGHLSEADIASFARDLNLPTTPG